ncbi:MAG: metallophosphoesterase [Bacteroidales bacterium]|nr:metallophosphoesterase [Bacteroidales bacterium]
MKKTILIAALALCAAACSQNTEKRLVILHVNDTHSHFEPVRSGDNAGLGGTIERAAYIDSVRKAEGKDRVLLLHAGDFNQGTSYFSVIGGMTEIETINAMQYDAVTLGNHEFDNGIEDLAQRLSHLTVPVVCANYDFSSFELGKYVKPYTIVERGGYKIGIFGMLTNILNMVDRAISDRIPKYDDFEVANKWAAYLKNEEHCDLVISLNHIGYEDSDLTDPEYVAGTRNIDLVVGGHSHTFLEEMKYAENLDGQKVPIVQDGCWGLYMGRIDIKD